jgi:hypothetical protein
VERLVAAKPNLFAIPFGIAGLAIVWRLMAGVYGTPLAVTDALSLIAAAIWLPLTAGASWPRPATRSTRPSSRCRR